MDFPNRVVIVTGGTGAVGRVVARDFATAGATVIVPYRSDEAFARLLAELGDLAARIKGQQTDNTEESQVDTLVSAVLNRHGRIDFLVNLAGATPAALSPAAILASGTRCSGRTSGQPSS